MAIEIHRILDEVRLLGCSDLHFTDRIAPVVRLNGTLRTMRSQYPEMDEEEILNIVHQMTNDAQQKCVPSKSSLKGQWTPCYRAGGSSS